MLTLCFSLRWCSKVEIVLFLYKKEVLLKLEDIRVFTHEMGHDRLLKQRKRIALWVSFCFEYIELSCLLFGKLTHLEKRCKVKVHRNEKGVFFNTWQFYCLDCPAEIHSQMVYCVYGITFSAC